MLQLSIWCTRFGINYSSCTGKRSENICSSSIGAQEKGKTGWNSVYHQNWWFFKFQPPSNANVLFFGGFFVNLTLCMTKLRVLVLCLSYFADNSIAWNLLWGLLTNVQYPIVHHKIKVFMLLKKGPLLFCIAQNFKNKKKLFWWPFPNQEVLWFYFIYNGQLLIYFSFFWVVWKFGERHTSNEGVLFNTHKDHTMAIMILVGSLSNRPMWSQLHNEWYNHAGAIW